MQTDSNSQPPGDNLQTGAAPPPVIGAPLPLPPEPARKPGLARQALAILLSLCLGLFLADAVVSLLDDSLGLLCGFHPLTVVRGVVFLFALLTGFVVYGLMGLTPMIPKRLFLPVTLFNPAATLALFPLAIYFHRRFELVGWIISLCQVVCGLGLLCWAQGGLRLRWPLVAADRLGSRCFGWLNLAGFLLVNVFVLLPVVVVHLAVCAALAVGHFSEGFLTLRPGGFTVQVRKYVRDDGKTIQLVPMAHIGEADFYWKLSRSFPTNAVVLMEGVSDNSKLLTNSITYQRMASSLGLTEQAEEFNPIQVEMVMADVDVEEFTANTIGFLNLVMLVHAKGMNADTVRQIMQYSPPPHFEGQLIDDLISKRNRHLLEEIRTRLPDPEPLIVPWGVAHMPGIADGIRASGFRLAETRDYTVIRFRSARKDGKGASQKRGSGKPK
jgi:hypothetical protein